MATIDDITRAPSTGLRHIDALLDDGPGWNWVTPTRTTLYYTFSLTGIAGDVANVLNGAPGAFNGAQQAAAAAMLAYVGALTGISFAWTADAASADLHFAQGDINNVNYAGYCRWNWSYTASGSLVTSYVADAYIYLDSAEHAATTGAPSAGNAGYQILLHEVGHALGLKHPFEGDTQLPNSEDDTAHTVMSYTWEGGPYSTFGPYDVAALMFLYGGDGLGGALGQGGGHYLIGTDGDDTLLGTTGDDVFEGGQGDDTLAGGAGEDTARYNAARHEYAITWQTNAYIVSGPDGDDSLSGIEAIAFSDSTVMLVSSGNSAPTGGLAISGQARQGALLRAVSTLNDADGLGPLSYQWQASADGVAWTAIADATASTFSPGQAQVGMRLRVTATFTDGGGTLESAQSAATSTITNVNDPPLGSVAVDGLARSGNALRAIIGLTDADGLGAITYQWEGSTDGSQWSSLAGATNAEIVLGAAHVGLQLRIRASYVDGFGMHETVVSLATEAVRAPNHAPTGQLTVDGSLIQGAVLTAVPQIADADGLGALTYRWQASADGDHWADITGAGGANFTPTQSEVGRHLRVVAGYLDGGAYAEVFEGEATTLIANVNDAPSGAIAVSGIARQGTELRVASTLADADGLGQLRYQWQSSPNGAIWTDIPAATSASFTPDEAQVGQRLRVSVHYVDGYGYEESVTSGQTSAITNTNDAPTGSVAMVGHPAQGFVLTAVSTLTDADGMGTLDYAWQSSATGSAWTGITAANGNTLTLGSAQLGLLVRVVVRYTDGHGTRESVASGNSTPVAASQLGTTDADTLTGTDQEDSINGLAGDDRIVGHAGNDHLAGGPGLDFAVYALPRANYSVAAQAAVVQALMGPEGMDVLEGIERIVFADGALAFDLEGHAGTTARILGAVFGPSAVANALYAGIGLQLLDEGMSNYELIDLALATRLGAAYSATAVVELLYANLTGVAPSASEIQYWTQQVNAGVYTPVSLAWMAADLDLNAQNIGMPGLVESGLPYLEP